MDYIVHHGILGQKWGVRRYQNKDGTLTRDGQKRYLKENEHNIDIAKKSLRIAEREYAPKKALVTEADEKIEERIQYQNSLYESLSEEEQMKMLELIERGEGGDPVMSELYDEYNKLDREAQNYGYKVTAITSYIKAISNQPLKSYDIDYALDGKRFVNDFLNQSFYKDSIKDKYYDDFWDEKTGRLINDSKTK